MPEHATPGVMLAEVQFSDPPTGSYTYRVPDKLELTEVGIRVEVPFGHRSRVGFLTGLHIGANDHRYRDVISPVDRLSLIPPDVLELTRWMAEYYLCDWGEALATAVPKGLKPHGQVRYRLSEAAQAEPLISEEVGPAADLWRALAREPLTAKQIRRRFPNGSLLLEKFRRRGWLEAVEVEPRRSVESWTYAWRWTDSLGFSEALAQLPKNARRMRRAVELLAERNGVITQPELTVAEVGLGPAMRSLMKRGWVTHERVLRDHRSELQQGLEETASGEPELSQSQVTLVEEVRRAMKAGGFKPFLLHGVTGSGKTLVYLEVIAEALSAGRGAIVMVPEISLTPQLVGRVRRRFGETAVVTHSRLSDAERRNVWSLVRSGRARVVVGPRSVVFSPVRRLGLIIVDEEQDDSYKQADPAPRYHGRDAALYRASRCGATVLLGSATPDVGSYFNAEADRYQLLELPERHGGVKLPDVWVVKWGVGREGSLFNPKLHSRIADRLERGQQVILLVNRRGFSTFIRCPDCGDVARCPNCDITLRYHRVGLKMECHYCGFSQDAFDLCPKCRGHRLRYGGIGTQRVQRELELHFPSARIERMDLDTTRRQGAYQEILTRFARREFDILLGTQMVAKGHDFPGVTLVGILAADYEWLRPDFRTVERAFRLLLQASGRTGRTGGGEVVIQAWEPTHPLLRWVQKHDYHELYRAETASRQRLNYPPFGRLVTVLVRGAEREDVEAASTALKERIEGQLARGVVLGPAPPPIERLEGQIRRRLLIKLPARLDRAARNDKVMLRRAVRELERRFARANIRFVLDVDPVEI